MTGKVIAVVGDKILNNPHSKLITSRALLIDNDNAGIIHEVNKNLYILPGGHLQENENMEDALRREVLEETGCKADIVEFVGDVIEKRKERNFVRINHIFLCRVTEKGHEILLEENEVANGSKLVWIALDEIVELMKNNKANNEYDVITQEREYLGAKAALEAYETYNQS